MSTLRTKVVVADLSIGVVLDRLMALTGSLRRVGWDRDIGNAGETASLVEERLKDHLIRSDPPPVFFEMRKFWRDNETSVLIVFQPLPEDDFKTRLWLTEVKQIPDEEWSSLQERVLLSVDISEGDEEEGKRGFWETYVKIPRWWLRRD